MLGLSPHLVDEDHAIVQSQNRNFLLAQGFHQLYIDAPSFIAAIRYQAQADRLYRRAVADLNRLRALREELANEPDFSPQPEETPQLTLVKNEPVNPHPPEHYGPDAELLPQYDHRGPELRAKSPDLCVFPDPSLPPQPEPY